MFKIQFNLFVAFLAAIMALSVAAKAKEFDPHLAPFAVQINNVVAVHDVVPAFVLPDEKLRLVVPEGAAVSSTGGAVQLEADGSAWIWQGDGSYGHFAITITGAGGQTIIVNGFVMYEAAKVVNGSLNGYQIGSYPSQPFRGLASYRAPRGFVEVTPQNANVKLSPHFTLGQFICKQSTKTKNKYVVIRPELLLKLEQILQAVNARGIATSELVIMSGYRTPYYNRSIGNGANSRHIYGGAADIYIDVQPRDGVMDDLNGDGVVNKKDAVWLYNLGEHLSQNGARWQVGGMGLYGANAAHGPFVHVDVRGYRARWGQ